MFDTLIKVKILKYISKVLNKMKRQRIRWGKII